MDDDTTAAGAAPDRTTRHVPHDLVREILIRLPVRSLLRFTGVCKAWGSTIYDDPSFSRAQLRHNKDDPCLLIAPQREAYTRQDRGIVATAGLYRWRESHGDAALVHPMDSLRSELAQPIAHCDGLVLVVTGYAVRVLNPATGIVLKLPESLAVGSPASRFSYQAFGLGRDPRTKAYKVARLYKTAPNPLAFVERSLVEKRASIPTH
ncbi:hypothetical protein ACQ4PT_024341 [Festuca glaucescens]